MLIPHYSDFPIPYNGTEQSAYETMKIVATQMEVSFESIDLGFYDDRVHEVSTGSPLGRGIFLESDKGDKNTGGLYWGQGEHGKYEIWLNRRKLSEPESMVATLAHEIAHIKLLGANQAFQTFTKIDSHGWRSQGYLSQMEWGYALALFAYVRGEKSPTWINHLTPNVKSDFLQGQNFIEANPKLVF